VTGQERERSPGLMELLGSTLSGARASLTMMEIRTVLQCGNTRTVSLTMITVQINFSLSVKLNVNGAGLTMTTTATKCSLGPLAGTLLARSVAVTGLT